MPSKLKTQIEFEERNGRTYSRRKDVYENGQVAKEGTYTNSLGSWSWDIPVGVVRSYFESGQLMSEEVYDDHGTRSGESVYYDKTGKLLSRVHYEDGRKIKEEILEGSSLSDDNKSE